MTGCPISKNKIDGNVARVNGVITLVIIAIGVFNSIFWILLTIDFFLRSFIIKYSPIANISKLLLNYLKTTPSPIDAAPKMFAARIGFMMSIVLIAVSLSGYYTASIYFAIFFSIPVFLEAFLGYCLGCQIYSVLTRLNLIKHKLDDTDFSSLT